MKKILEVFLVCSAFLHFARFLEGIFIFLSIFTWLAQGLLYIWAESCKKFSERNMNMRESFKMVNFEQDRENTCSFDFLSKEKAEEIQKFHKSFPMYEPTPLACLADTAKALGLGAVYVKDESYRFGLNAFKVLGGSYAIGNYLAGRLGKTAGEVTYGDLISEETRTEL